MKFLLFIILIFSSNIFATVDTTCAKKSIDQYWRCHNNALGKASSGNFKSIRSQSCETDLTNTLVACYGDLTPTSCDNKVIRQYYLCQSNLNDKYASGNLKAGRSSQCLDDLQSKLKACHTE